MGKQLGCLLPRPRLIPNIDGNYFDDRQKRQGCLKECLKLEKSDEPKISVDEVSKVRRLCIGCNLVVSTF